MESAEGAAAVEKGLTESKLEVESQFFALWGVLKFDLSLLGAGAKVRSAWSVGESVLKVKVSII